MEFEWTVAFTVSPGVNPVAVAVAVAFCFTVVGVTSDSPGTTSEQEGVNSVVKSFAGFAFVAVVSVATSGVPTASRGTVVVSVPPVLMVSVCRRV
jgi:hypothetical protein